jgi:hypothetical protein
MKKLSSFTRRKLLKMAQAMPKGDETLRAIISALKKVVPQRDKTAASAPKGKITLIINDRYRTLARVRNFDMKDWPVFNRMLSEAYEWFDANDVAQIDDDIQELKDQIKDLEKQKAGGKKYMDYFKKWNVDPSDFTGGIDIQGEDSEGAVWEEEMGDWYQN